MFQSHSLQEEKFDFFVQFLRNILNGKEEYKELVRPIIIDAHLYATNQKDIYNINRDGFPIIVFLAEKDKIFFEEINPDVVSNQQYETILKMASGQKEIALA